VQRRCTFLQHKDEINALPVLRKPVVGVEGIRHAKMHHY
jgi:hypothetical protein